MTTILQKMLNLLTSAYNKRPEGNIGKLFSIFAEAIAGVVATLNIIKQWRDIDQAQGAVLNRIGANFGVVRGTASDNFYRLMIKVKITAMLSGGDIDTIINSIAVLLNVEPSDIDLVEDYPAKVWLYIDEEVVEQEYITYAPLTASIIFRLIAAGIGKRIFLREYYETEVIIRSISAVFETSHYTIRPKEE